MPKTLTMNARSGPNRADHAPQGLIGQPLDRVEGPLKASGHATYAFETRTTQPVAYGHLATAGIAKADLRGIDTALALAVPGVIAVVDCGDYLPNEAANFQTAPASTGTDEIHHYGQPLLLVVAESAEAAREGALAIVPDVAPQTDGRYVIARHESEAGHPAFPVFNMANQSAGDFDGAFAKAPVKLEATYTTPSQIHAAMEPHAALAEWKDDKLTIHASYQALAGVKSQLVDLLGVKSDQVRVLSPYVGGGFGSKLGLNPEAVTAAIAARVLDRPVKVAMTRQQLFHIAGRRSDSIQYIKLGADTNGRLTAIAHDNIVSNRVKDGFYEPVGISTVSLYAAENRRVTHRQVLLDLPQSNSMRAPGEAIGQLAFESAMDEMAEKLGMDPVAFRILNEPEKDPKAGTPFSSRMMVECLEDGAAAFGWADRPTTPASRTDGEWLVGMGMAGCARSNYLGQASARVTLTAAGRAIVETDMTDIGTGTYTVLTQIAGDMLGLTLDRVTVTLADSDLPPSAGSGGSWGASSSGSSVYLACEDVIAQLAKKLRAEPEDVTFKDGLVITGNRAIPLTEALGNEEIEGNGTIKPGLTGQTTTQATYGAVFCEVAVNRVTAEVRVRRMHGTFACGRIFNEKTAKSQLMGGMVWGLSGALLEEAALDPRHGLFVNHDLAEYHVPVHADVPAVEVTLLSEEDDAANPLKSKGLGELGICGSGAAVANAIYNATGVRVRDFPITLDKLLEQLPE